MLALADRPEASERDISSHSAMGLQLRDCCLTRQFSQMQIHSVDCAISPGRFGMVEGLVCT
jgi:hypothetical protein